MTTGNQEYAQLLRLREAIVGKNEAQRRIEETKRLMQGIQAPQYYTSEGYSRTSFLKREYEQPFLKAIYEKESKRNTRLEKTARIFKKFGIRISFKPKKSVSKKKCKKICDGTSAEYDLYVSCGKDVKIDYAPLYQTEAYQEAMKLDVEELPKIQEKNRLAAEKATEAVERQKLPYQNAISEYQAVYDRCCQTISDATFLNSAYHTLEKLDAILYYFEYNRADTVKEAMNQYVHDQQMLAMIETLKDGQRKQLEAMREQTRLINARLNSLQSAISLDLSRIEATASSQLAELASQMEQVRYENDRNTRESMEAERRKAGLLESIRDRL